MSRTLHQIPTEVFRVEITCQVLRQGIAEDRVTDFGPYLSIGTAKACVTREVANYKRVFPGVSAEIFRYALPGEWEVVK